MSEQPKAAQPKFCPMCGAQMIDIAGCDEVDHFVGGHWDEYEVHCLDCQAQTYVHTIVKDS